MVVPVTAGGEAISVLEAMVAATDKRIDADT